jgi:tRNA threonylcarbamoyladenosine biosynthesis protein TsaB|tara:strand:- start:4715 stop:5419 length:705 start_codon:yes stop_codon:yes gene_type:complete
LAFDVAGAACSVALWAQGRVVARRFEARTRGHADRLLPMIGEVLAETGLGYPDLDGLAVTQGPGGFTGVRIGLATARGLALASGKPLVGVDNFHVLAAAVPAARRQGRKLAILIDAKRADLYLQLFDAELRPLSKPQALAPDDLPSQLPTGPLLLAGDAVALAWPALAARDGLEVCAEVTLSDAAHLAAIAASRPLPDADAGYPAPLYLRPPDVTQAKPLPGQDTTPPETDRRS